MAWLIPVFCAIHCIYLCMLKSDGFIILGVMAGLIGWVSILAVGCKVEEWNLKEKGRI